jgi:hypothetical protein
VGRPAPPVRRTGRRAPKRRREPVPFLFEPIRRHRAGTVPTRCPPTALLTLPLSGPNRPSGKRVLRFIPETRAELRGVESETEPCVVTRQAGTSRSNPSGYDYRPAGEVFASVATGLASLMGKPARRMTCQRVAYPLVLTFCSGGMPGVHPAVVSAACRRLRVSLRFVAFFTANRVPIRHQKSVSHYISFRHIHMECTGRRSPRPSGAVFVA